MPFVLLEILKEASNLSSIHISPHIIVSLFSNNNLQKYLNKMIKKLKISGSSEYIFSKPAQMEQFCTIFSNIEDLTCEVREAKYLSFLLNRLPKLSMIKEY